MSIAELQMIERPLFLVGMPRSGTSWLSQIFESHPETLLRFSPNYSFEMKNMLACDAGYAEWKRHLQIAVDCQGEFITHSYRRQTGEFPTFANTGSLPRLLCIKDTRFHQWYMRGLDVLPDAALIYIVRHPAACLNSWRNCKEFSEKDDFQTAWLDGGSRKLEGAGEHWGFADWFDLTLEYVTRANTEQRIRVVRYEDLVRQPIEQTRTMFQFAGLELPIETIEFLHASTTRHDSSSYSVFKAQDKIDGWEKGFPSEIWEQIQQQILGTPLEQFLRMPGGGRENE